MDKDQVFVPPTLSEVISDLHETKPGFLFTLFKVSRMLIFGWPAYLVLNVASQKYEEWTSHFKPSSPIFDKKQWWLIVQSDLGILTTLSLLCYCCYEHGVSQVIKYYGIPYLFVNMWLVMITFLQHTHEEVFIWKF